MTGIPCSAKKSGLGAMNMLEHGHDATVSFFAVQRSGLLHRIHHGVGGDLLIVLFCHCLSLRCIFVMHNSMDIKEHSIALIFLRTCRTFPVLGTRNASIATTVHRLQTPTESHELFRFDNHQAFY